MNKYQGIIEKIFRPGTRRGQYYELVLKAIYVIFNEGWGSFWFRFRQRLGQHLKPYIGFMWRSDPYQLWLACNEPKPEDLKFYHHESQSFPYRPKISIITPVWNTDKRWLELAVNSVINQAYDNWELCLVDDASSQPHVKRILTDYAAKDDRIRVKFLTENLGIAGASNQAIALAGGEFVGFLDHDDELRPDALYEVVKLLNQDRSLDLIYTDEDRIDAHENRTQAFFKPDWSPDLLMSMNYIGHFTVVSKDIIDNLGGFCSGLDGSQDYDLVLRVTEKSHKIAHISRPLYSWRIIPSSAAASFGAKPYACDAAIKALSDSLERRGISGQIIQFTPGRYRVKYAITNEPLVSIIIPTKDSYKKLARCINSIEQKTTYKNYELIIIDHDSQDPRTISYLSTLRHKVIKYTGKFNFSRMNNLGAGAAGGEHIVFLNDDTEVIEPGWLAAMLEHSQRREIGMVGALLLYPRGSQFSGKIQHAGAILGMGVAGHAFKHTAASHFDYLSLHRVIRNCSAVTAACAMLRKDLFREMGGFSESLPVAFNDVDLCLRLRAKGYLITYTPFSVLYHDEGGTRGFSHPAEDETNMLSRWADVISKGDPYYNRNLTLMREDFSLPPRPSAGIPLPLAVLLEAYYVRVDLHLRFPEVANGKYEKLIDWAMEYGLTVDTYRHIYRPYCKWYVNNASQALKPLAVLLELYNFSSRLQEQFPEALKHDFTRLLSWAYMITADGSKNIDVDKERLLPYRNYYKLGLNP
jgi:GT2 family glycosyltransferase